MIIVLIAVLGYLFVALGVLRWDMPRRYEALRTPHNGVQMSENDARRETVKLSCQTAFTWPLLLAAFTALAPMVLVFDGIPAAGRAAGRGAVAVGRATAPALAPVTTWATKPLDAAVSRDRQLALAARADEPVADVPLVPDEIATWTPPKAPRASWQAEVDREMDKLRVQIEQGEATYLDAFVVDVGRARRIRREEA